MVTELGSGGVANGTGLVGCAGLRGGVVCGWDRRPVGRRWRSLADSGVAQLLGLLANQSRASY